MNCNRFRFLIQQRFEFDLQIQDDQLLSSHLDSCQSCARFEHQLDQVVQAAGELPLPEEAVPNNLESLARMIMQQLPQPKSSPLDIFGNLFGGRKTKEPKQKKQQQQAEDKAQTGSRFPHVKRQESQAEQAQSSTRVKRMTNSEMDDQKATTMRLSRMSKKSATSEAELSQSGTHHQSLGAKFGMAMPSQDQGQDDQRPTTLADDIRRKMMEEKQAKEAQHLPGGDEAGWAAPGGQQPQQPTPPVGVNAPAPEKWSTNEWGQPSPPAGGGWDAPGAPQGGSWGSEQGQPAPQAQASGYGQPAAPQPPQPPQPPQAPQGGWGEPATPQAPSGGGWDAPSGGSDWGQPTAPQAPGGNDWGQPAAPPAPQGGGWGEPAAPQAPGGSDWGQPAAPPAPQGGGWGDPAAPQAPGGGGWGEPAKPAPGGNDWVQPAAPPAPQGGGWGDPAAPQAPSGSGWGDPAAPQAPSGGGWGEPAAPQAPAPTSNDGWGSPAGAQSPQSAQSGWGQSQDWAQPQQQASPSGSAWDEAPAPQAGASTWSAEAEQVETGTWEAFKPNNSESLGAPTPAPGAQAWGAAPQAPQPAGETGEDRWDIPIQERMKQSQSGSQPAVPQDAARWDIPIQERMKQSESGSQPAAAPPPPAPAQAAAPAASGLPTDSIMNRLSNILGDGPAQAQPAPVLHTHDQGQPPGPDGEQERWDVPIQERMKQQAAAPEPAAGAAPDRWDVPIQERMNQAGATPPAGTPEAPLAGTPQAPPVPPPPQPAAAGGDQDRWDIPIQERMKQGQAAQAPAPPPAPAPVTAAAAQAQSAGMFNLDDNAMDRLFSQNLGVTEQQAATAGANQPAAPAQAANIPAPPVIQPVAAKAPAPPQAPAAPPPPPVPQAPAMPTISPVSPRASAETPAPPAPAAAPASSGLLKNLDDGAIDKLFSDNLGVTEQAKSVAAQSAPQAPPPAPAVPPPPAAPGWSQPPQHEAAATGWGAPPPAPQPAAPPPAAAVTPPPAPVPPAPAASAQASGGLLKIDDEAMDRLFADNLGVKDSGPAPPKVNVNEAVQSIRTMAETSGVAEQPQAPPPQAPPQPSQPVPGGQPPPRIEGLGRLASNAEPTDGGSGKIASIGKFLLDQQDLSKIGNIAASDLTDSKMRILTLDAAQELQNLLNHIQQQPGVLGSVIVGHDGILIANSMPQDLEAESIGIWALGVYFNTDGVIKKLQHKHVHQVVCRTPRGYLIIADFGGGILVTLSEGAETEKLIPLMRSITQLVSH